jgi:hypothetical protein
MRLAISSIIVTPRRTFSSEMRSLKQTMFMA